MPHSAASDLVFQSLLMSHKKDTRLKWVKIKMKFEAKSSYIRFIFIVVSHQLFSLKSIDRGQKYFNIALVLQDE